MKHVLRAGVATTCLAIAPAQASEVTTYTYDALGRLVAVTTSGEPNNGLAISTAYDPAGNRSC